MKRLSLAPGYEARMENLDAGEWHSLVAPFADLTVSQTVPYAQARWPRSATSHLVLRRRGEVVAAMQSRILPIPPLGAIAYARGGPLWRLRDRARDLDVLRQMARAIHIEHVHRRGHTVQLLPRELEDCDDVSDVLREEGFGRRPPDDRTIVIDLGAPLDRLRAGLVPRWRTELNRAQRAPLVITEGTLPELFDRFAPVFEEMHERKHLVDAGDLAVYRRVQELLPEHMRARVMLCSDDRGNDVAGAITSSLGETALGILWATNARGRELRAAYLLQWHVLDWLKREGCLHYDLGGIDETNNPGCHRFKVGLAGKNGREVRLLGKFEQSASQVVPTALSLLTDSRTALRRFHQTSKSLLARSWSATPSAARDTEPS